jgi:outer membrane protein OmpA-like peptidoglycan-associated protein
MINMRRSIITIVFAMCIPLIAGCTSSLWNHSPPPSPAVPGAVIGAAGGALVGSLAGSAPAGALIGGIWGGALGAILACKRTLVEDLLYNGVQVIRVGDDVKIILPSDRFFYPHSSNLNPNYFPILNEVVILLRSFDKITVRIAAYTGDAGDWRRNLALTRLQARTMLNFFVNEGIDSQLTYAVGCGNAMPIATEESAVGQSMNRRVEITLRRLEFEPLV